MKAHENKYTSRCYLDIIAFFFLNQVYLYVNNNDITKVCSYLFNKYS